MTLVWALRRFLRDTPKLFERAQKNLAVGKRRQKNRQEIARLTTDASPWRHLARELAALLALRAGERDGARDEFRRLAQDATAPAPLKARAAEMAAALDKKQG